MSKKLKEIKIDINNEPNTVSPKELEFVLSQYLEEAENTTRSEITAMKKHVHDAEHAIQAIYHKEKFSASDLYNEQAKKQLLERKLKGLEKILKELF